MSLATHLFRAAVKAVEPPDVGAPTVPMEVTASSPYADSIASLSPVTRPKRAKSSEARSSGDLLDAPLSSASSSSPPLSPSAFLIFTPPPPPPPPSTPPAIAIAILDVISISIALADARQALLHDPNRERHEGPCDLDV
eukprot:CAMPEP_0206607170 /NCGR_PEP_ID=MMETSP0325_2-20121206/51946_1 /ASSEMBLY_ACC=CAM_ASM_000347 /TAXON_ID=2866 /ORGANISM="Crypthecodinium cohnii, Strain Seligo" /LENGTH=138 /DNA_ID=CAMNT_0054124043 /DNA_START=165 /DNA_END=577 /DNA_ORIENTATION=-